MNFGIPVEILEAPVTESPRVGMGIALTFQSETGGSLANSIGSRKAAAAFKAIVDQVGRDDVTDILLNWDVWSRPSRHSRQLHYEGRYCLHPSLYRRSLPPRLNF